MKRDAGFTLLELLVVLAVIALGTAGVSLALRDSGQTAIEREAVRLAALLDAARAQSRTTGEVVLWESVSSTDARTGSRSDTRAMRWTGLRHKEGGEGA